MLKIIIPLAGSSELFSNAGYYYPKPLIEVNGLPMIEMVLENPRMVDSEKSFIFIIKEEDAKRFHLDNTLKILAPNCEIIKLAQNTKGGLCSVLMAIDKISVDDEILILNGDQVIDFNLDTIYKFWSKEDADAGLITFNSVHPRWSYARLIDNVVVQTAEKNPISNFAIAGAYYFKNASIFFEAAFKSIKEDVHLDGLFYISPVINQYVLKAKKVITYKIDGKQYHLFYSPQVLEDFERNFQK
ncbi:nucleotidyl transferase [Pedobacter chinensis]|uniref:Nucleotidyl transferase n=1 Tax=Pedobacter chinensis TaxID=2282421 RepID=A0A369PU42_9SPHI|nr:glycosyltransferase family 2 protein [Pedobacter chinensis]RDC54239.1 nucleotidyl transferase [Pedobacter chinensis]